jgi:hypothetical protein
MTGSISRSSVSGATISASGAPFVETLARYRDFFALFEDFRGYVEFFILQDLVAHDYSAVRFFMSFDNFNSPSKPTDRDTYKEYRRLSVEFIEARNCRIDRQLNTARAGEGKDMVPERPL